jgi:hypothetical protein
MPALVVRVVNIKGTKKVSAMCYHLLHICISVLVRQHAGVTNAHDTSLGAHCSLTVSAYLFYEHKRRPQCRLWRLQSMSCIANTI